MRAMAELLIWTLTIWLLDTCEWFDRWATERRAKSLRGCAKLASLPTSRF